MERAGADELKQRGRLEPYKGKIKQVADDGSVLIEVANGGEIERKKEEIEYARVDVPPGLQGLLAAADAQQYAVAARGLKSLAEHLIGLPEPADKTGGWVSGAAVRLVDCYIHLKEWAAADSLLQKIKNRYPKEHPIMRQVEIADAQVLAGRQKIDDALKTIATMVEPAAKILKATPEESRFYARAYLAQGDINAGAGRWKDALTSYLTVLVLYYHDASLTNEARYKAGLAYESMADWNRAAEIYAELLKEAPQNAQYRKEVKDRLDEAQRQAKQNANQ